MNSARLGNAVRIVIAPDTFKGSISAGEAARCLSTGIREARADAEVAVGPMADGGERTLDAALVNGYERREAVVHGPLGAPLRASFADELAGRHQVISWGQDGSNEPDQLIHQ